MDRLGQAGHVGDQDGDALLLTEASRFAGMVPGIPVGDACSAWHRPAC